MQISDFLARLDGVKRHGDRYTAKCPAHDDHTPSLSIREGSDGRILLHCFAGCSVDQVVGAMGLKIVDLFPASDSDNLRYLLDHGQTAEDIAQRTEAGIPVAEQADAARRLELREQDEKPSLPVAYSAEQLQQMVFPPTLFFVDRLLPEGTSLLTAASKIGKSWMVLDMGLKIASGKPFMGRKTTQAGVLYLALEDSFGRLQGRLRKVLRGQAPPKDFYFMTRFGVLGNGFEAQIQAFAEQHPEVKLIIIDTLQKIRGIPLSRESPYSQDYREMGLVKGLMERLGLSVLFVHHNRKMRDDSDPFNQISGTNGLMGAADTALVITKEARENEEAKLHIVGRDVDQQSIIIRFDKTSGLWEPIGDADHVEQERARQAYENSLIVQTIKSVVKQGGGRWSGSTQNLLSAGRFITGHFIAPSAQKLSHDITRFEGQLLSYDGIIHERSRNGTGGGKHCFYCSKQQDFVDCDQDGVPFSDGGVKHH